MMRGGSEVRLSGCGDEGVEEGVRREGRGGREDEAVDVPCADAGRGDGEGGVGHLGEGLSGGDLGFVVCFFGNGEDAGGTGEVGEG